MTKKEALNDIIENGINLGAGDFVSLEALKVAAEALQEPERMKGRWEEFDYDNSYRCTACGEIWTLSDGTPEENNMNYCSFCGADMRGEEE